MFRNCIKIMIVLYFVRCAVIILIFAGKSILCLANWKVIEGILLRAFKVIYTKQLNC